MDLYMMCMYIIVIIAAIVAISYFADGDIISGFIVIITSILALLCAGVHHEEMRKVKGYTYEITINDKTYYTNDLGISDAGISFTTSTGEHITTQIFNGFEVRRLD